MQIPNLPFLKTASPSHPDYGVKLVEALQAVAKQASNTEQQGNLNPSGQPIAPPPINGVKVTGRNGHFNIAIQDGNSNLYRDVHYWAEHSESPNFTNPVVIHMGQSRNYNEFLGNTTRYWRAYSSYSSSPPSSPAYHGSAAQPLPVTGGGSVGGPAFQDSQGSGTGQPGQGLQGPGVIPFRGTGLPPVR